MGNSQSFFIFVWGAKNCQKATVFFIQKANILSEILSSLIKISPNFSQFFVLRSLSPQFCPGRPHINWHLGLGRMNQQLHLLYEHIQLCFASANRTSNHLFQDLKRIDLGRDDFLGFFFLALFVCVWLTD